MTLVALQSHSNPHCKINIVHPHITQPYTLWQQRTSQEAMWPPQSHGSAQCFSFKVGGLSVNVNTGRKSTVCASSQRRWASFTRVSLQLAALHVVTLTLNSQNGAFTQNSYYFSLQEVSRLGRINIFLCQGVQYSCYCDGARNFPPEVNQQIRVEKLQMLPRTRLSDNLFTIDAVW